MPSRAKRHSKKCQPCIKTKKGGNLDKFNEATITGKIAIVLIIVGVIALIVWGLTELWGDKSNPSSQSLSDQPFTSTEPTDQNLDVV